MMKFDIIFLSYEMLNLPIIQTTYYISLVNKKCLSFAIYFPFIWILTAHKSSLALLYISFLTGSTNEVYHFDTQYTGLELHVHIFVCYMTPINACITRVASLKDNDP